MYNLQKLGKNEVTTIINMMDSEEKKTLISLYNEERSKLLKEYPKLQIGDIDSSLSRFPFATVKEGKTVIKWEYKVGRRIFLDSIGGKK